MSNKRREWVQLDFHENLGMRLRGAYLLLHRRTNAHFAQFGVTSDQFVVLSLLLEQDGISQQELAHRSYSDANTIRAMLALLERQSLVTRAPHPTDRRARLVSLTPNGRKLARQLTRSLDSFHEEFRGTLPSRQADMIFDWLGRVIAVMQESGLKQQNLLYAEDAKPKQKDAKSSLRSPA